MPARIMTPLSVYVVRYILLTMFSFKFRLQSTCPRNSRICGGIHCSVSEPTGVCDDLHWEEERALLTKKYVSLSKHEL